MLPSSGTASTPPASFPGSGSGSTCGSGMLSASTSPMPAQCPKRPTENPTTSWSSRRNRRLVEPTQLEVGRADAIGGWSGRRDWRLVEQRAKRAIRRDLVSYVVDATRGHSEAGRAASEASDQTRPGDDA